VATYCKRELPNYQVFDERRYFVSGRDAGSAPLVFEAGGLRFGVLICEDAWFDDPPRAGARRRCPGAVRAQCLAVPPRQGRRARGAHGRARRDVGLPLLYAHLVGGQDEVVFDGASFAVDARGVVTARAPSFEEACCRSSRRPTARRGRIVAPVPDLEARPGGAGHRRARLHRQERLPGRIIGLSGGIDSALVLAIAVDALGADRVRTVMMPSPYTADISWIDARDMAARLGVRYDEIAIEPDVRRLPGSLAAVRRPARGHHRREPAGAHPRHAADGAVQQDRRHRADHRQQERDGHRLLHAVRRHGRRLRGHQGRGQDAGLPPGALAQPAADVPPTAPGHGPGDPRAHHHPAALGRTAPDQTDQDSLPPYEVLDAILERYMEDDQGIEQIVAPATPRRRRAVTRLIKLNEYKRRQAPVGIRITHRAFGRDWRYPITSKFRA
jgi:NAD+ synthase (glutamine-hydrolysing)